MPHKLSTTHLINQGDTSIKYPNDSTKSVFTDNSFYTTVAGKTGSVSGNIKGNGCGICTLAMFALYKGGLTNTNDNVYYAVLEATKNGTNNNADVHYNSFNVSIGSQKIAVNLTAVSDIGDEAAAGNICFVFLDNGAGNTHYVLVDGWNPDAQDPFDKYLVCDSDGGVQKTLRETMSKRGFAVAASSVKKRYRIS